MNAVTLWNSRYMDRAVGHLRDLGQIVDDGDFERISPLIHAHIELHGRYSFDPPEHIRHGELRHSPTLAASANSSPLLPRGRLEAGEGTHDVLYGQWDGTGAGDAAASARVVGRGLRTRPDPAT